MIGYLNLKNRRKKISKYFSKFQVPFFFNFPFEFIIFKNLNLEKNGKFICIFPTLQKASKSYQNFKSYRPKCKHCQEFLILLFFKPTLNFLKNSKIMLGMTFEMCGPPISTYRVEAIFGDIHIFS